MSANQSMALTILCQNRNAPKPTEVIVENFYCRACFLFMALLLGTLPAHGATAAPKANKNINTAAAKTDSKQTYAAAAETGKDEHNIAELPNLDEINRPVLQPQQLDINTPRKPSFKFRDGDGTEIREYRERDRAPDIEVKSGAGTAYKMSSPPDGAPPINDDPVARKPSIDILKF